MDKVNYSGHIAQFEYQEGLAINFNPNNEWLEFPEKYFEWNPFPDLYLTNYNDFYFTCKNLSDSCYYEKMVVSGYNGLLKETIRITRNYGIDKLYIDSTYFHKIYFRFDDQIIYALPWIQSTDPITKEIKENWLYGIEYEIGILSPWLENKTNIEIKPSR